MKRKEHYVSVTRKIYRVQTMKDFKIVWSFPQKK